MPNMQHKQRHQGCHPIIVYCPNFTEARYEFTFPEYETISPLSNHRNIISYLEQIDMYSVIHVIM